MDRVPQHLSARTEKSLVYVADLGSGANHDFPDCGTKAAVGLPIHNNIQKIIFDVARLPIRSPIKNPSIKNRKFIASVYRMEKNLLFDTKKAPPWCIRLHCLAEDDDQ